MKPALPPIRRPPQSLPRWWRVAPLWLVLGVGGLGLSACGSSWSHPDTNQSSYAPGDASAPVLCTADADCAEVPRGPCEVVFCDADAGRCALGAVTDGTPCTAGDACVVGQRCQAGVCRGGEPRPPCAGVQCGVDVCGNDCGGCQGGTECVDGACQARACADSDYAGCCLATGGLRYCDMGTTRVVGCGDLPNHGATCGWEPGLGLFDCVAQPAAAPDGAYLCPGELCAETPCEGRECGWACGQDCGTCGDGARCVGGACVACGCEGRACGDDGCGASCGACGEGEACQDGACVDGCGPVGSAGCCQGDTLRYCDGGVLVTQVCDGDEAPAGCGWRLEEGWYGCGGLGADPEGIHPHACDQLGPPDGGPEPGPEADPEQPEQPESVGELGPEPVPDAGAEPVAEPVPDAALDTGWDAGATPDTTPLADATPDAAADTPPATDAAPDTTPDTDTASDATPDATPDLAPDAAPVTDVTPDAAPDATPDAG